jgi:hypothetical protein
MCSSVTLAQIHCRLEEIFPPKNPTSTFGNRNILIFLEIYYKFVQKQD